MSESRTLVPAVELPADFADVIRTAADLDERPRTLRSALQGLEIHVGIDESTVHPSDVFVDGTTRHELRFDDRVEHVPCLLDALFVARLLDASPVEIRSTPPTGGSAIEFTVAADGATVTPEDAVTSFGFSREDAANWGPGFLDEALDDPDFDGLPTCDLINAFPDDDAYEAWRETVPDQPVMRLSADDMIAMSEYTAVVYGPS